MFIDSKIWLTRPLISQLICILLVVLIIILLVGNFVLFKHPRQPPVLILNDKPEVSPVQSSMNELDLPLFGEYVPESISDNNIKQSVLNMTVMGIMFDPNERASQVIIRDANHKQRLYMVGDTLSGDAVIKRIMPDGVLITRSGLLESLRLRQHPLNFAPQSKPLELEK